jgi:hypothetical protein
MLFLDMSVLRVSIFRAAIVEGKPPKAENN